MDEAKLEQLFIGLISRGGGRDRIQGTVETLGFSEEICKQMASGRISKRQQSYLQSGSAQPGLAGCRRDSEEESLGGLTEKAEEARVKGGQEGWIHKLLTKHKANGQRAGALGQCREFWSHL